jgi:prepilin-type N-terminal cleavage/methylation domain-containing protein
MQRRYKAFTLIELLVVVAIISLLCAILIPTLGKARESARRAVCKSNLRSIGQAIRAYMDENNGFYPPMAHFRELDNGSLRPRKMMCEILSPFVGKETKVFRCPSDRITEPGGGLNKPADKETYFDWQGSSYDAITGLSVNDPGTGKWDMSREDRFLEALKNALNTVDVGDLTRIAIVYDYENFHGNENQPGARQALFADFHVDGWDKK